MLELIDASSEQCKTAANACRALARPFERQALQEAAANDPGDLAQPDSPDPLAEPDQPEREPLPLLDSSRLILHQIAKVALDADDV